METTPMKTTEPTTTEKVLEAVTETIDLTPSWTACVRMYCAVLQNPKASSEAKEMAESELMRLATHVDNLQAK
jgi:hypothetical protein